MNRCQADPVVARYARTLYAADGAFPRAPEYASAIEKPRDPDWTVVKGCAVIVAALVGALLLGAE